MRRRHVGYPCARFEHDARHTTDGDVGEYRTNSEALLINDDEGPINDIDLALLDEDDGHAFLDRGGFERRKHCQRSSRCESTLSTKASDR